MIKRSIDSGEEHMVIKMLIVASYLYIFIINQQGHAIISFEIDGHHELIENLGAIHKGRPTILKLM